VLVVVVADIVVLLLYRTFSGYP